MKEAATPSLQEQVKQGIKERHWKIGFIEEIDEVTVSAVIITDHCVDGRVFKLGRPANIKGLKGSSHGWTVSLAGNVAPGVTEYIGPCDGTAKIASIKKPNLEAFRPFLEDNREFIELLV